MDMRFSRNGDFLKFKKFSCGKDEKIGKNFKFLLFSSFDNIFCYIQLIINGIMKHLA